MVPDHIHQATHHKDGWLGYLAFVVTKVFHRMDGVGNLQGLDGSALDRADNLYRHGFLGYFSMFVDPSNIQARKDLLVATYLVFLVLLKSHKGWHSRLEMFLVQRSTVASQHK